MQSGFEASFAQQMQAAGAPPEGIDIGVPVWLTAATGTVNAWAAVQYQPVPPHPPTVAPAALVKREPAYWPTCSTAALGRYL